MLFIFLMLCLVHNTDNLKIQFSSVIFGGERAADFQGMRKKGTQPGRHVLPPPTALCCSVPALPVSL